MIEETITLLKHLEEETSWKKRPQKYDSTGTFFRYKFNGILLM